MDVADVLEKAAALLETQGWGRFTRQNATTGHMCAVGGIAAAVNGDPWRDSELVFETRNALEQELHDSLMQWNDRQRDKRKVTRLFRRVAKQWRESNG